MNLNYLGELDLVPRAPVTFSSAFAACWWGHWAGCREREVVEAVVVLMSSAVVAVVVVHVPRNYWASIDGSIVDVD